MDSRQVDALVRKALSDRRRVLGGLGAVALGSLGVLTARGVADAQVGAENTLNNCKRRCRNRFCDYDDETQARRCRRRCLKECRRHH